MIERICIDVSLNIFYSINAEYIHNTDAVNIPWIRTKAYMLIEFFSWIDVDMM